MYLNDVADGGETRFTILNISVRPRRGRVVLWPSVLDAQPNERDDRTEHEGCPAKADKWLFNCQMWADPKADGPASDGMRDSETPVLSDTLI